MTGACLSACRITGKNDLIISSYHLGGLTPAYPKSPMNPTNSINIPVIGHLKKTSNLSRQSLRHEPQVAIGEDVHAAEEAQSPSPFLSPRKEVECLGRADDER